MRDLAGDAPYSAIAELSTALVSKCSATAVQWSGGTYLALMHTLKDSRYTTFAYKFSAEPPFEPVAVSRPLPLQTLGCADAFLGVDIRGNAAPIISHRHGLVLGEFKINASGFACDRFVHSVVQNFRGQMVESPLIGAADIHARPAAHGLQTLKNLYILRGIRF